LPELPDVTLYLEALESHFQGVPIEHVRVISPFVVRTFEPHIRALEGRALVGTRRLGKRLVLDFDDELFLVIHLMIAGRLRKKPAGAALSRKVGLLALDFQDASLVMTEASSKKRASVHVVKGEEALAEHNPGGVEPLECLLSEFADALRVENHTVKRSLTDPRLLAGIGNAYSDEILHRAKMSPLVWTQRLSDVDVAHLFAATRDVLEESTERLRTQLGDAFPDKVTAFHEEMSVHGRYRLPCPVCETPVQRIRRADSEVNYCPTCQTGGKLLADRGLSRLLKGDWPRSLDELEQRKNTGKTQA
jgi:formamidopyrimidine-DNA glycosylase